MQALSKHKTKAATSPDFPCSVQPLPKLNGILIMKIPQLSELGFKIFTGGCWRKGEIHHYAVLVLILVFLILTRNLLEPH